MFKKIFALATVLIALPALANAWTLNTWAKSQGGVITSDVYRVDTDPGPGITYGAQLPQTVAQGSLSLGGILAATPSMPVVVDPADGWKISKLEINGIIQTLADPTATQNIPAAPGVDGKARVYATFARQSFIVTATAGSGGTIDKSSYPVVYTGYQSPAKSFTFTPLPGQNVSSVGVTGGLVNGVDYQLLNAVTGLPVTMPADAGVKVKINIVNVKSASIAVNGVFGGTFEAPADVPSVNCNNCHVTQGVGVGIFDAWSSSKHRNSFHQADCSNCHIGANAGAHPGSDPKQACATCHTGQYGYPGGAPVLAADVASCESCHSTVKGIHSANTPTETSCIACHDVAIKHPGNVVSDNNGVRSITQEFTKWSHHVTGVALNDAHCAACHLAGKYDVTADAIRIDPAYHMVDAKIHLRNADTDADMQWDPAAPNHSTMDSYCMSCHDANGATSLQSIITQGFINTKGLAAAGKTASASNPFGDTISNRYDKMQRPAVVNVNSQFNTTNNSHHGVKGPRYSGRTRTAGPRAVANDAVFTANSSATLYGTRSTIYDSVNAMTKQSEFATNPAFNALYVPLENAGGEAAPRTGSADLGDDSTLHCGDCHTVGQWAPGVTTNAAGVLNAVAIGTHGSNNEYLLRNSTGTDERHTQDAYVTTAGVTTLQNPNAAFLVCFNCHSYKRYGSVYNATGATGPHAGEYDAAGRCNGVGNTIPFNGYTTGTATDGTQFESRIGEGTRAELSSTPAFAPGFPLNFANAPGGVQAATYTGEQNADFGNIFGIQCLNCHNSGIGNGYGGIHGSANNSPGTANTAAAGGYAVPDPSVTGGAYVDGMGNTNKVQRFLPGLGNIMHVPGTLGGFTGGTTFTTFYSGNNYNITTGAISNDANWEQIGWKQITGNPTGGTFGGGAGCYTINDEGTGGSLDDVNSASYGIKGQSYDGGATIPNAAKTWGGCDDHTGTSVGGGDHGFYKRINRPVTY